MKTPAPRRRKGARPLADFVTPGIAELCGKAGFAVVEVVTHWDEIVGPHLGPRSLPVRLQWPKTPSGAAQGASPEPATLVVRVEGPYAIELQHAAPVLLERINAYFGWRCVGRLALRQGPVPARTRPVPPAPLAPRLVDEVRREIGPFEDEALASSLAKLGALVRRERGGAG